VRLNAPMPVIEIATLDIFNQPVRLSDFKGKKVILSFFRNAACPFCNFRLYEFTHQYKHWQDKGVEVIAVFSSNADEVRKFVANHPRPFKMVSDPNLDYYQKYGVERSGWAMLKALMFKFPRIFRGMKTGGYPQKNNHLTLVPADFLIDENGGIVDVWYGRDTSDHIPLPRVEAFIG